MTRLPLAVLAAASAMFVSGIAHAETGDGMLTGYPLNLPAQTAFAELGNSRSEVSTLGNGVVIIGGVAIVTVATLTVIAAAGDVGDTDGNQLFTLTANGGSMSIAVDGQSVPDLVEQLLNTDQNFATFNGSNYTANLRYASLDSAVVLGSNADGTAVTLAVPSIGLNRSFTAGTRGEVEDQVVDFLTADGSSELAAFINQVNQSTQVGVADGNPTALTAMLAADAYSRFGQERFPFTIDDRHTLEGGGWHIEGFGGQIDANGVDGAVFGVTISSALPLGDRAAIALSSPLGFRSLQGSDTYYGGLTLGVPIGLVMADVDRPVSWQLAPFFQAGAAGSADQISGGVILGGGITSQLGVRLDRVTLSLGNQVSGYGGTPITFGDYEFETDVSQWSLKNGIGLTYDIDRAFLQGTLSYTSLLEDAAVDGWISPGANVGLRLGNGGLFRVGWEGDFGKDYTVNKGMLEFSITY